MKAYKIVRTTWDGHLTSAFHTPSLESDRVLYVKGEWTLPKVEDSRLFVFDTYESAIYWAEENVHGDQIWECGVDGIEEDHKPFFAGGALGSINNFLYFGGMPFTQQMTPSGTLVVEKVKLIKKCYEIK